MVKVLFEDNDSLQGEIISMDGESLELLHAGSPSPLKIDPARVVSIAVFAMDGQDSIYTDRIHLSGGRSYSLPCKILEIDEKLIRFKSPFTPLGTIKRSDAFGVSLNVDDTLPLWKLPLVFNRSWWQASLRNREARIRQIIASLVPQQQSPGVYTYQIGPDNVDIGHEVGLDLRSFDFSANLRFSGTDGKPMPNWTFGFRFDAPNNNFGNELYRIHLDYDFREIKWLLTLVEPGGSARKLLELPVAPDKRMELSLKSRPSTGRQIMLELCVNNMPPLRAEATLASSVRASGSFGFRTGGGVNAVMENPILKNRKIHHGSGATGTNTEDLLETYDEESIPGTLVSYSPETRFVTFAGGQDGRTMQFPAEMVRSVVLRKQPASQTVKQSGFAPCSILFKDGSIWKGTPLGIGQGVMVLQQDILGRMEIPLPMISKIDFYNQKPPVRSTP